MNMCGLENESRKKLVLPGTRSKFPNALNHISVEAECQSPYAETSTYLVLWTILQF
jgi:hypothetical protein